MRPWNWVNQEWDRPRCAPYGFAIELKVKVIDENDNMDVSTLLLAALDAFDRKCCYVFHSE